MGCMGGVKLPLAASHLHTLLLFAFSMSAQKAALPQPGARREARRLDELCRRSQIFLEEYISSLALWWLAKTSGKTSNTFFMPYWICCNLRLIESNMCSASRMQNTTVLKPKGVWRESDFSRSQRFYDSDPAVSCKKNLFSLTL